MAPGDRKDAPRPKNVYLTGFMCAGKTAVGRALARALGRPFCDSDAMIERAAGSPISALVRKRGWASLRSMEAAQLRRLASSSGQVIALGGGVYPSRRWRRLLEATGVTVFLSCRWRELRKRLLGARGTRPLLAGAPDRALARAKRLYAARRRFYERALIRIDTTQGGPARAAAGIRRALRERSA